MTTVDQAIQAINSGELVIYPTETTYGLGANALDEVAVQKLFEAKQRKLTKPISIAFPTIKSASKHVELTKKTRSFANKFLPGPVTILCKPTTETLLKLSNNNGKIGVRIPRNKVALDLLNSVSPLTATSANISGKPSPCNLMDLDQNLLFHVSAILDGGTTPGGHSTVVDLDENIIIRKGSKYDEIISWMDN
tara:strand:+ start:1262 stop:1840 length:579 start_codon:yes stop_codon:yes gene_type:complete